MVNLLDLFHQKMELIRLEKKYIHNRHRRSHFVSDAVYVDGEYLYEQPQSPTYASSSKPTSSSSKNSRSSSSLGSSTTVSAASTPDYAEKSEGKRTSWGGSWGRRKGNAVAAKRREFMVSVKEVNHEDSRA